MLPRRKPTRTLWSEGSPTRIVNLGEGIQVDEDGRPKQDPSQFVECSIDLGFLKFSLSSVVMAIRSFRNGREELQSSDTVHLA